MSEFLYIAANDSGCNKGGIYVLNLKCDFVQVGFVPLAYVNYLVLSPNRPYLYAAISESIRYTEDGEVAAFKIQPNGKLNYINSCPAGGLTSCHLSINENYLYCANYRGGTVAEFMINNDGGLISRTKLLYHNGSSIYPERQKNAHPHCVRITPDKQFLAVADLGCDCIFFYPWNKSDGILSMHPFVYKTVQGNGPRHIVFDSTCKTAYVVNELSSNVDVFDYEAGHLSLRQTISTLPADFSEGNTCAAIAVMSDQKQLLVSNRGHDSVVFYNIMQNGELSLAAIKTSGGFNPWDVALIFDMNLLAVANEKSNRVNVFSHSFKNEMVMSPLRAISLPRPVCIVAR